MTTKRRITALALFAATVAATTVLLPATTAAQEQITVETATELPYTWPTGGGRRGTAVCPNTHPYLWNRSLAVLGFFTELRQHLPGGIQIFTKVDTWAVFPDEGNTPIGRRAVGATFSARHNDPFRFTQTERITLRIYCTNDPNESYGLVK